MLIVLLKTRYRHDFPNAHVKLGTDTIDVTSNAVRFT